MEGEVARLVFAMTGDEGAVEETCRETFVTLAPPREKTPARSDVLAIAYRLALGVSARAGPSEAAPSGAPGSGQEPRSHAGRRNLEEDFSRVAEAFEGLSGNRRGILYLRVGCGLNERQISEIVGEGQDAVREHLEEALAHLRAALV